MTQLSIQQHWDNFWKLRGGAEFHSELHKEQVMINYFRPKGFTYRDGEVFKTPRIKEVK